MIEQAQPRRGRPPQFNPPLESWETSARHRLKASGVDVTGLRGAPLRAALNRLKDAQAAVRKPSRSPWRSPLRRSPGFRTPWDL